MYSKRLSRALLEALSEFQFQRRLKNYNRKDVWLNLNLKTNNLSNPVIKQTTTKTVQRSEFVFVKLVEAVWLTQKKKKIKRSVFFGEKTI